MIKKTVTSLTVIFIAALAVVCTSAQTVTTFTDLGGSFGDGLTFGPSGDLYASGGYNQGRILRISPQGDVSEFVTGLNGAVGGAFDSKGNLYVSSYSGNFVYAISPAGEVIVFSDGLDGPSGVFIDGSDRLFVAEFGAAFSRQGRGVKRIASDGSAESYISGGGLQDPVGIVVDEAGNMYACNWGIGKIFKITPDKNISLLATIPGSINQITYANGRLYVPSPNQNKIFSVDLDGTVTLVAGTGEKGSQDGPAMEATFSRPNSVAATASGDTLFVIDANPGIIRMITLNTASSQ